MSLRSAGFVVLVSIILVPFANAKSAARLASRGCRARPIGMIQIRQPEHSATVIRILCLPMATASHAAQLKEAATVPRFPIIGFSSI